MKCCNHDDMIENLRTKCTRPLAVVDLDQTSRTRPLAVVDLDQTSRPTWPVGARAGARGAPAPLGPSPRPGADNTCLTGRERCVRNVDTKVSSSNFHKYQTFKIAHVQSFKVSSAGAVSGPGPRAKDGGGLGSWAPGPGPWAPGPGPRTATAVHCRLRLWWRCRSARNLPMCWPLAMQM